MTWEDIYNYPYIDWLIGAIIFICWLVMAFFAKRIIFKHLMKLIPGTDKKRKIPIQHYINAPVNLLIFFIGILILEKVLPLQKYPELDIYLVYGLKIILILVGIFLVDRIVIGLLNEFGLKKDYKNFSQVVFQGIIRGLIFITGSLILLDSFGVSISPLLASLGIGTLAVALALQPTLSNLFAGLSLGMDGTIQVGDFIELENKERGYVMDIGWRASKIKLLSDNIIVIPNSILVNSTVTNFASVEPNMKIYIYCGVHYESDLRKVTDIGIDVAREVINELDEADKSFDPLLRFIEFSESSINFRLILKCNDYMGQFKLTHEIIIRLHERFKKEGIVIPFPLRTFDLQPKHERLIRELVGKPEIPDEMDENSG